jgi:hypothetical protein
MRTSLLVLATDVALQGRVSASRGPHAGCDGEGQGRPAGAAVLSVQCPLPRCGADPLLRQFLLRRV